MKKFFLILPVCLLILTSCNFPFFKSPAASPDLVNTMVAQTMQAKSTVIIITATDQPATPLATITPTPTTSITPTATALSEDPSLTLGTATFSDSFTSASSGGSAFDLTTPYSDDAVNMSITNGSLLMSSFRIPSGIRWRLTYPTPRNYYLEASFKTVSCAGSDYYGLVMRSPSYTDGIGYYLALSCDGKYYFMRFDGSNPHVLINWTTDPAILGGENQENRLGVMLQDNHFTFYVNGKKLQQVDDSGITSKGYFGVFLSSLQDPNMTIQVEQIDEWDQP